ncbi:MAG: hypothetical protein PX635_15340 [Nostocales cyanobacterium LE14-WE12]|jgi:hypothetical protein|nr:hypothetical protein [Nostocales cyanobacterium LE14-WE12]
MAKRSGPSQIEIGTGVDKITITNDQQMNDATLRIERDEFTLKDQSSSKPVGYIKTGIEGKLEISIADISAQQIALLFGVPIQSDTDTVNSVIYTMRKVEVTDQAGTQITGQKVVLKPYPILSDPGTTAPTTTTYNNKTYGTVQLAEDAFDADVAAYKAWVNNWVTFPNGALTSINGTNLAFGLQTQQELKVTLTSLPDSSGVRIIFGDETVA